MEETKAFIVKGEDFCCTSIKLLNYLLVNDFKCINYGRNKKYPSSTVWFFKMDDKLKVLLEDYLDREVIWEH